MSNTFSVAIQRCTTYQADAVQAAVEQAVNLLGGMRAFVKPGGLVLIKPNLLFARPPEAAVTTHPAVVEAVARLALDCGGRVVIGDSPPLASAKRVAEMAGIADVARRLIAESDRPIEIVYTGLRPGEKLHEILVGEAEEGERPMHPGISHVQVPSLSKDLLPPYQFDRPDLVAELARVCALVDDTSSSPVRRPA